MDVVEIDGASNNSVDDIRGLRESARYPPVNGRYKLYIIDEVHMLSTSAFNALLKILEEPPGHLVFVFATTEPHKVLPTILSRCQRFDFRRMQIESIVSQLKYIAENEGMAPETDALVVIARKADGSMRDAQSIFDQVRAFCGEMFTYTQVHDALNLIDQDFYFRVTTMMLQNDPAVAFDIVDNIMKSGYDVEEFLVGLAEHFRHMLSVLIIGSARLIETVDSVRERYEEGSASWEQGDLIRGLKMTLDAQREIRTAAQPRLRMELLLTRLAVMDRTVNLDRLLSAIAGMPEGGPVVESDNPEGSGEGEVRTRDSGVPITESPRTDSSLPDEISDQTPEESPSVPEENGIKVEDGERSDDSLFGLKNFPTGSSSARSATSTAVGVSMNGPKGANSTEGLAVEKMVTIDEVQAQWPVFREHYASKPRLMFALELAVPSEIHGNVLQLGVESERERELIGQYKEEITTSIQSFFRMPLVIEGVVRPSARRKNVGANGSIEETRASEVIPQEIDHPFVRGIVSLLGAVPI
jgi:DNA polymerase-3 subunit gamma/tau